MNQENYTYPARVKKINEGYSLEFYDFDCYVEEEDLVLLLESARTELALAIIDMLDRGEKLPEVSVIMEGATYVHIWLPYYRNTMKEIYVRKSVTIPQWLDILAKERGLDFSSALTYGLKHNLELEAEE